MHVAYKEKGTCYEEGYRTEGIVLSAFARTKALTVCGADKLDVNRI